MTSRLATAAISCTSTTGSRSAPTRADGSTSPGTRRERSARGRKPGTSTTSTRHSCSAWSARRSKSFQYELFTTREWQHAMFFRDRWTPNHKLTLDLGLRWEYYPIMPAGRSADRDAGLADARCLDRRRWRQSEEHGPGGAEGRIFAAGRRHLSPERQDGAAQRLRRHARRPRDGGTGSVPRRLQLSARAERELPACRRNVDVRMVRHDQPGHSAPRGAGSEQRPHPAAELLRHADRRAGVDAPRPYAFVERRVRAAHSR